MVSESPFTTYVKTVLNDKIPLRVIEAWRGVKEIACNLLQVNLRDSDLTTLLFPGHTFDAEVMWLLGSYVHYMDFYSCKTSHFYQSSAFWSSEVQIQK